MGRPSKYKPEAISEMIELVREQAVDQGHGNGLKMKVTDEVMCSILEYYGYSVNVNYIEKLRKLLVIAPKRGKFFNDELATIHSIIRQYTTDNQTEGEESWKMTISDKAMAEILCQAGFEANAKYVERQRRSLGIKASQSRLYNKSPYRPIKEKDVLISQHNQDAFRLSTPLSASCNMYGSAGLDTYSQGFGRHTSDYDAAITRKKRHLKHLQNKAAAQTTKPIIRNIFSGRDTSSENEIEAIFNNEINKTVYGKIGKGGAVHNTHNSQAWHVRFGQ